MITFVSLRDDNMEVYVMSAEGSGERNLTNMLDNPQVGLIFMIPGMNGDDKQEFELEFDTPRSGECVRKRYEGDQVDDTDPGTFILIDADELGEEVAYD